MRSSDIAARCRETALRVDASGEWGELGDTLREAAAEVERLRREIIGRDVERQRLRMTPEQVAAIDYSISRILDHDWYGGPEPERVVALRSLLARQGGGE